MRVVMALMLVGIAATARARLPERETPRATDLLRADHLAERAKQRLRLPPRKGRGWVRGGGGFGHGRAPGAEEPAPGGVRIEIRTPRPRRSREP